MKAVSRNAVALVVTVVVHLVLLLGFVRVRPIPPRAELEYHTTWITIPSDKPIVDRARKQSQRPPTASEQMGNETTAPTMPVAIVGIDWLAQGEQSAGKVAARVAEESERRSLSTPHTHEQQRPAKEAVGLFRAPLQKHGDTQRVDGGEIITWDGDECYATNRPFAAPQLDENRQNVVCKDPFKARTDLFGHIKPKYLQGLPAQDADHAVDGVSDEAAIPTCGYSTFRCK